MIFFMQIICIFKNASYPPQPKKNSFISLVSYHTNRRALQTRDKAATIISDTNLWETTNGQTISNNRMTSLIKYNEIDCKATGHCIP